MPTTDALNLTFSALADPTRRAILTGLAKGEQTVTEIAEPFDITMPAITKHLKVLEKAGLIEHGQNPQSRPSRLKTAPLKDASEWIENYRQFWGERFDCLDDYLNELQSKEKTS